MTRPARPCLGRPWSIPGAVTAWLPPDGSSGRFEHFDARPGLHYRLLLTYAGCLDRTGKASADSDIVEVHSPTSSPECGSRRPRTSAPTSELALAL